MVQFGLPTVEAAMKLGREAADYISGTFIKVCILFYLVSMLLCRNTLSFTRFYGMV